MPLNVILSDDTKVLDEVVVVGYGTQKKVNVTGAVSMVGSDVIESRPVANVSQALQGAVPVILSPVYQVGTLIRMNIIFVYRFMRLFCRYSFNFIEGLVIV